MGKGSNVVYLTYDGLTDPLGQSQIIPYLIGLTQQGYRFTIISFEKSVAFKDQSHSVQSVLDTHNISWQPLRYTKWPPVISTVWDVLKLWQAVKKLHRIKAFHIIHCRSYITALIGLKAKKELGVKFLFDMRGFWADERVEGGLWNLQKPIYRLVYKYFKYQEKNFWQKADHVISLTENAQQEMRHLGVTSPITVIPTCTDLNHFDLKRLTVDEGRKQRQALGIDDHAFLLVYSGSWGTWYLTDFILVFFDLLRIKNPNAHFLIISPDVITIPEALRQSITHKKATRGEMPALLASADASVFFIKTSYSKKASSATKLGELLAMQLPVVTNGGWGDIQAYAGNGVMVLPELTTKNMEAGVDWILTATPKWPSAHLEKLSLGHGVEQYTTVYKSLLT